MKSIRIGNDIRIEWPIVLSGDVSKLQDLDLTVEVRPSAKIIDTHNYADEIRNNDNKRLLFEKHETTVMMNGGLECRRDIGDGKEHCRPRPPRPCPPRPIPPAPVKLPYHIEDNTLIAMWTADRQFATGDYDIILYAHKNEGGQAVCDQYRFVRLVSHTAQADAPDDSGIEAVIAMQPVTLELSGLSAYEVAVINGFQGTEEDWLASLKKPAEDAAEELKQEIEQFKEDTKEELQADIKALGYYEDNPEFIRAYTDAEGKFLWGIRIDGSIEWAKGVPTPIQNALKELADKIKDLGGDKIEEVETALNEKIEALQDAIDVINASLKTLTDTFSYQDNPEFVNVVTDADGKVLFGIKADGKPYFPKNETYSVESNQEFLAAWLDAAGHVLFGLRQDGSTYVAKADFLDKIEEIRQLLEDNGIGDDELKQRVKALEETFSHQEDEEFAYVVTDAEGKVLFGIKTDGSVYIAKSEYIDAVKEIQGKITSLSDSVQPLTESFSIISNDEYSLLLLDKNNNIIFSIPKNTNTINIEKYSDVLDLSVLGQTIKGGYIEIQPDSYNAGTVPTVDASTELWGFPYSLKSEEQDRLRELLLRKNSLIRYIRLPLGFAYRGARNIDETTQLAKNTGERYTGQNEALKKMCEDIVSVGGGLAPEYWCPPPYWVTSGKYAGNGRNELSAGINILNGTIQSTPLSSIKSTYPEQYASRIDEFTDAIINDLEYLHENIAPVRMFGLQNEPEVTNSEYGSCGWDAQTYNDVLEVLVPKINSSEVLSTYNGEINKVLIHVGSTCDTNFKGVPSIFMQNHPEMIWGYSHHYFLFTQDSNDYTRNPYKNDIKGDRDNVIANEYEYFTITDDIKVKEWRCANNMAHIINDAVYGGAEVLMPIIHICKQIGQISTTSNTEGYAMLECNLQEGYGLAIDNINNPNHLGYGEFKINNMNFNAWSFFDDNLSVGATRIKNTPKEKANFTWCAFIDHGKLKIFVVNYGYNDIQFSLRFAEEHYYSFSVKEYSYYKRGEDREIIKGYCINSLIPAKTGICFIEV